MLPGSLLFLVVYIPISKSSFSLQIPSLDSTNKSRNDILLGLSAMWEISVQIYLRKTPPPEENTKEILMQFWDICNVCLWLHQDQAPCLFLGWCHQGVDEWHLEEDTQKVCPKSSKDFPRIWRLEKKSTRLCLGRHATGTWVCWRMHGGALRGGSWELTNE